MNEVNINTHDHDCLHDVASIDLERLLASGLPRITLLPVVKARVKLVIAQFVERASSSSATADAVSSDNVADYLRGASAVPLEPKLCTLMARVGFDKALFTYGHDDGVPVGYAEGMWLLKFVERTEKEPSMAHDPSWLRFIGKDATRH